MNNFPEGRSQVNGYKFTGSVRWRNGEVIEGPLGGKNS